MDSAAPENPFSPGSVVLVTLGNPREKLWGSLLALAPEGLSLCGIELSSFDDLIAAIKDGSPFSPGVLFFPMHRVERIELDRSEGELPSLAQRFTARTGIAAANFLSPRDSAAEERP